MSNTEAPLLKISALKKTFGALQAVKGLSFEVQNGQIYALLGPNGAGKSTTLSIIAGLQKGDEGQIIWNGLDKNPLDANWKKNIGVCPQELIIYPNLTCLEQLIYTGRLNGMNKESATIKSKILLDKLGLKEKQAVRAHQLSGGMKRRLNLSLALVHEPGMLILDEPEAGLDPQSRVLVRDFIKEFVTEKKDSRIVLYTTHNMDEAQRIADKIGIIDHGVLLAEGTCTELIQNHAGGQTVELECETSAQNEKLLLYAEKERFKIIKAATSILFFPENIANFLVKLLAWTNEAEIGMPRISVRTGDLEDVFIKLTGRRLRE